MSWFNTFSMVARDPDTGMLGIVIASKALAVGAYCVHIRAGVGAVATQAYTHTFHGIDILERLAAGLSVQEALDTVLALDPGRDWRQLAVVNAQGDSIGYTGAQVDSYSGHLNDKNYAAAGNLLVSAATVEGLVNGLHAASDKPFAEALLNSLAAGDAAGGDKRGRQSAALMIMNKTEMPYLNLRVDDHPSPITELLRLYELAKPSRLAVGELISSTREPRGPAELEARQAAFHKSLQQGS
jgi:uncharacterized Ntn-hydrolase superfamily protein